MALKPGFLREDFVVKKGGRKYLLIGGVVCILFALFLYFVLHSMQAWTSFFTRHVTFRVDYRSIPRSSMKSQYFTNLFFSLITLSFSFSIFQRYWMPHWLKTKSKRNLHSFLIESVAVPGVAFYMFAHITFLYSIWSSSSPEMSLHIDFMKDYDWLKLCFVIVLLLAPWMRFRQVYKKKAWKYMFTSMTIIVLMGSLLAFINFPSSFQGLGQSVLAEVPIEIPQISGGQFQRRMRCQVYMNTKTVVVGSDKHSEKFKRLKFQNMRSALKNRNYLMGNRPRSPLNLLIDAKTKLADVDTLLDACNSLGIYNIHFNTPPPYKHFKTVAYNHGYQFMIKNKPKYFNDISDEILAKYAQGKAPPKPPFQSKEKIREIYKNKSCLINLDSRGMCFMDKQAIPMDSLESVISQKMRGHTKFLIDVRFSRFCSYEEFLTILVAIKRAQRNVKEEGFVGQSKSRRMRRSYFRMYQLITIE